ncbi:Chromosome partition protein Smc [Pirellulimonas nuda]|uniref:Chromosome partition protein Smc n=1 Tax=Pirellulimonas nuda TaxID=2528009 RepID=A0A518DJ41_9BACT|nr:c-type cytochrome domain-containing protein [Pirellulimonas nuda]QDU91495.1 Chromosome partition protein Smc [Pirellulimonas nuda]
MLKTSITACSASLALCIASQAAELPEKVTFDEHVAPIFREHCFACHSQDGASSDLALDTYAAASAGGAGGEVLVGGDAGSSRLWKLVNHEESPKMPPGDKLPDDQLAVVRAWIDGGLLENNGSKPKKSQGPGLGAVQATTDNRPVGEPAMPRGWFREPAADYQHAPAIGSLAASPWAPLIAAAAPKQVLLFHSETGQLLGVAPFPLGDPQTVRFSRDGSVLVVGGGRSAASGAVALIDVETGVRLGVYGDELDTVLAADLSPDRSLVALGGPKKKVRVYRVADGELAYEIGKHTDWVTALEFSPDGALLATADRGGAVELWHASEGYGRGTLAGHKGPITSLCWRSDSAVLASASEDGEVRMWSREGKPIKNFAAHGGGVLSVALARDGALVTAGRDAKVKTWAADGKPTRELAKLSDIALAACFTHDGARVAVSDWAGVTRLLATSDGVTIHQLDTAPPTLDERVREALERLRESQRLSDEASRRLDEAEAGLARGEAAHAAYSDRLAAAELTVADAKQEAEAAGNDEEFAKRLATALTKAETRLATAENKRRGLPDLAKLQSEVKRAATGAQEQSGALGELEAAARKAEKELATFQLAAQRLAADAQQAELDAQTAAAATAEAAAQAELRSKEAAAAADLAGKLAAAAKAAGDAQARMEALLNEARSAQEKAEAEAAEATRRAELLRLGAEQFQEDRSAP